MQGEANDIMGWAAERELTGTNFVWEQLDKHFFLSIGSKTWISFYFAIGWSWLSLWLGRWVVNRPGIDKTGNLQKEKQ